jgi:hypothetical protein
VLADQPPQHRLEGTDHLFEAQQARLDDLLAAEGEQLAGERGGALPRLADLVRVVVVLLAGGDCAQQVRMEGDRRQQVVEGVGDAARQAADRLQPLRVAQPLLGRPQRLLGRLALGDVAQHPAQPHRVFGLFLVAHDGHQDAAGTGEGRHQLQLHLLLGCAAFETGQQAAELRPARRRHEDRQRLAAQAPRIDAQQRPGRLVGLLDDPAQVGDDVADRRQLEQLTVAEALDLQRFPGGDQLFVLMRQLLIGDLHLLEGGLQGDEGLFEVLLGGGGRRPGARFRTSRGLLRRLLRRRARRTLSGDRRRRPAWLFLPHASFLRAASGPPGISRAGELW